MSLSNKVAIVTGGSSGIGAAIAARFAAEGAKVVIVGRNEIKLATVTETIEKQESKPLVIAADVTKEDDTKRIVEETMKHFGRIDILINNAGVLRNRSILDAADLDIFDEVMNTNLRAVVYLTHLAAPHIIKTKGNIVNISSTGALKVVGPGTHAYAASKAALDHFTRCAALELAEKGVRVNCVNPGPVVTDAFNSWGLDSAAVAQAWTSFQNMTALKRCGDREEIADLVAFVASDRGRSITGSCLVTDNGFLLK